MYSPGCPYIVVAPVVTSWAVAGQRMVFFHMFLQARVTLEAFPIVAPRGRSVSFPTRGTMVTYVTWDDFQQLKNGFKSIISVFFCSVSVENISLHFQTLILPWIVVIQWDFIWQQPVLHTEIWSSSSLSGMTWRNWDRLNPEELWQRLRDVSRKLTAKLLKVWCTCCEMRMLSK